MKIYSKWDDYYDGVARNNMDRTIHYIREQQEIELDIKNYKEYPRINGMVIGFCGKFYPFIHKSIEDVDKGIPLQHFYFYSLYELMNSKFWNVKKRFRRSHVDKREDYKNFFSYWDKLDDEPFIEVNSPVFIIKEFTSIRGGVKNLGKVLTNPKLADYSFPKVVNAVSAFQEIQQYLTNQLVKTKDPEIIDDKYRIAGHGFDKFSFRNPTRLKDLK